MLREGEASGNHKCRWLLDRPPSRTKTIMGACLLPLVYAKLHKLCPVMPGLDPGIHLLAQESLRREWIAGSSPAMTDGSMSMKPGIARSLTPLRNPASPP